MDGNTTLLDDFGGGTIDFGPPPGPDWTDVDNGLKVAESVLVPDVAGDFTENFSYWTIATSDADCEVFADIVEFPATGTLCLFARFDPVAGDGYRVEATPTSLGLDQIDAWSDVAIDSESMTVEEGDSFGMRLHGSTIEVWHKPAVGSWTLIFTASDATYGDAGNLAAAIQTLSTDGALDNFGGGDLVAATATIVVTDSLAFTDDDTYPLFPITDTLTLTDQVVSVIQDTLTFDDSDIVITMPDPIIIEDTLTFYEILDIAGPTVPDPASPATGGLDNNHVLRLLYGNDRRNPLRTLDLAESAGGHIFLQETGFAPGAGETIELWTDESVRLEGQKLLAESRGNSKLGVTYDLASGSMAGLFNLQSQINAFFREARLYQTLHHSNHKVWLEYRWSDGLNGLPTPAFGQLSHYFEIYSARSPRWPESLHKGDLVAGNVLGVTVELTASPAPKGLKQRAATAGGSVLLRDKGVLIESGGSSKLHWAGYTGSGLTGEFTVTGWITLNAAWASGVKTIFDYYVNASNRIQIQYDADSGVWRITKTVSGAPYTDDSAADTVTNGDDAHLVLVQDATTLYLYVNGALAASCAATATMTDGGTIALGCPASGTVDGIDVILDGWRIMPDSITSAQAARIYSAELPIKQVGRAMGPPPFFWTKDADNMVDNADDTNRDNWGVIGGVGGDLEAEMEIRITHSISRSTVWLGIKTTDEWVDIADYLYFDSTNSVADANYSGGGYYQATSTEVADTSQNRTVDPAALFGRYQALAHLKAPDETAITVTPKYKLGSYYYSGQAVAYTGTGAFAIVELGDLFIRHDVEPFIEDDATLTYQMSMAAASSFQGQFDFALLLPWPYARIKSTGFTTKYVIVEEGAASPYNPSGNALQGYSEYRGAPLRPQPGKYNHLLFLAHDSSNVWAVDHTATLEISITPRFLLPGGMVA